MGNTRSEPEKVRVSLFLRRDQVDRIQEIIDEQPFVEGIAPVVRKLVDVGLEHFEKQGEPA